MTGFMYVARHGLLELFPDRDRLNEVVGTRDNFGTAPLHFAAEEGQSVIACALLSAGALVDQTENIGSTPLALAAACGHINLIDILVAAGANVNHRDCYRRTPLHFAAQFNQAHAAARLLQYGADVNTVDDQGRTPMQIANSCGNVKVVRELVNPQVKKSQNIYRPTALSQVISLPSRVLR
jgi:ankyrin repeat protein